MLRWRRGGAGMGVVVYGLSEQRMKLNTFRSPYAAAPSLRYRFAPCYVPLNARVPSLSSSKSVVGPGTVVWVMVEQRCIRPAEFRSAAKSRDIQGRDIYIFKRKNKYIFILYICIPTNCTQLIYFINNTLKHMYCLKL